MPALADLKQQMRDLALKAHQIVTDEKLTGVEKREQLDKIDPDIKSLSDQIAGQEYLDEREKRYGAMTAGDEQATPEERRETRVKSLGEQVTDSPRFKAVADDIKANTQFRTGAIEVKTTLLESGLGNAEVIGPQRLPGVLPNLFQRLTIADLMPSGTTNSNLIRYVVETTPTTPSATTVTEGQPKPEQTLNFDVVDEPVQKIAVWLKVSNEMLEDMATVQSYINGRLALFVRIEEEAQLLSGNGTPPNISGILDRSGLTAAQPQGGDSIAVAVHKEITKIRVASFLDPDAIVFHPNNWQMARLEQDQNDQFYGGGPFTGAYGNNGIAGDTYWGLRVVSTTAEPEGTTLIGAFGAAAQVFRRSGLTVDMTNSDGTDFQKNIVTIRAEERLALAVYRPAAFGTVSGVASS